MASESGVAEALRMKNQAGEGPCLASDVSSRSRTAENTGWRASASEVKRSRISRLPSSTSEVSLR